MHAALSGWLVGMLAVGPAAAQSSLPLRLTPRAVPSASPSSVTVVAIPLDATARTEAARLAYWAEQSVARSGRLELVRLSEALDAQGKAEREAKAAEGAQAMKDGQAAYDELDTQKALERFDVAAKAFEAGDLSRGFGDFIRARVMKAASQVANGENAAAQLEIRAVLAVDPRAQFSSNFFPPDEMAFVDKERKASLAGSTVALTVRTEPVPAQVYVDGQFRGVSPVSLQGLTAADHFVTVMAPGYELEQRRAREGETALTLTPSASQRALQAISERIVRKPDGAERDVALRELGALAGVSQVLALLVQGGTGTAPVQVTGLRLDVTDGHNLGYAVGSVPVGEGMATGSDTFLSSLVGADTARLAGNKPVTHFSSGGGNRKTMGYVLMATGVALLAGGIYFGMEASSKEDDFRRAPQTSPRAKDFKDTGKTYALVADIGLVTGLVSAGLGSYFAFASGGGGGSSSSSKASATPARSRATPPPSKASPAKSESLDMPPPPKGTRPVSEPLPMPPPPAKTTTPAPAKTTPAPAKTTPAPQTPEPTPAPPPPARDTKRSRDEDSAQREEELKKRREEVERQRRELEERRKQEEADAEAKRKRDDEEKRKREEEEKKKKRPSIDEDDLRNY
ncbi:PEGA domain-containing protein [Myxococcus fulvus]|uniref:PEGA domain-containing protein n=1 Tax=Myxococcus fulvus TaxID=33 RepID=UPI003B9CFEE8